MIDSPIVSELFAGSLWTALVGLALATLISEDLTCISAGLLVAADKAPFLPVMLACLLGILVGDLLLVLAGRALGRTVVERWPVKQWISPEKLARAEIWFSRRGGRLVLTSRFVPGTRLPTYLAAGVLRAPWWRFVGWFLLACSLWTPLLVGGAVLFGDAILSYFNVWEKALPVLVAGGLLMWAGIKVALSLATWRSRRLLLAKWRRMVRWEFWPRWAVYPPVIAYIVGLGIRHRCLTLFTAVNPGIGAGGGLVGESKSEIMRGLEEAGNSVARWATLESGTAEQREAAVTDFMQRNGMSFPVVLKPDVGERGNGVVIARDAKAVAETVRKHQGSLIVQAYIPGIEFGVFYVRMPSSVRGSIFAITDKRMIKVTGDGRSTLERLILADDRAVCMAEFFLERFASRLDDVPATGELVTLSELGTHCRGALFLDGATLETPALCEAVDRVSRGFAGFYFGRYDVRAESVEAFQRGEFQVIELNGLTSEATSVYDPRHSVWHGWRILCRQWRLAFEIAKENRARGVRVLSLREVWRLLKQTTHRR